MSEYLPAQFQYHRISYVCVCVRLTYSHCRCIVQFILIICSLVGIAFFPLFPAMCRYFFFSLTSLRISRVLSTNITTRIANTVCTVKWCCKNVIYHTFYSIYKYICCICAKPCISKSSIIGVIKNISLDI